MASSSRHPRATQDEDDDDDDDDDPDDKLPLSQVLRIGNQEEPMEEPMEEEMEENKRKDSDGERFKRMKGKPMRVKDYVKHCAVIKDRMIDVGDIVWVNRWWPGWVQKRGHRNATVSLFGSEEKPCKFRLSEVYSFEEHFVSITKSIISKERSYAIDCALEEFERRFFLGVMCPCQVSSMKKANDEAFMKKKKKFQPKDVLRFVLGRAVSAGVDHEQKLNGAKMGAQFYSFRRFLYVPTDDENYRQEMRLSESNSNSTNNVSEPNTMDNIAGKEMSSEMISEDSYKEKGTFSPPTSDFSSEFQKEQFFNPATMPCALPLSVDGHLSSSIVQLQPSETSSRSEHPTSLHMKFPQDFKLPSKDELMEEFNQFGKLDGSKTKVFIETDSAQVSFLHKLDLEAAFQYAKRENTLFGGADVRFWLDPHEYPRRGTTAIAPPLPSPTIGSPALKLKSCLRTPDAHGKEDKIERNKGKCLPRRGTATIAPPLPSLAVGSPALKLKSCLRTPDAHGKEDKIERNKGKCLPESRASSLPPSKKNDGTFKPSKSCNSSRGVEPDISKPFLVLLVICQQIVNELIGTKDEKGKGKGI